MEEGLDPEKQPTPASTGRTETPSATSMSRPTRGYAHLAEFMTKTRHGMMRRFKDLSTQNLLYLQAELYQLKFELDREAAADAQFPRSDERSNWDFHWNLLATSGQRGCDKRWKIWLKLRERLYEYQDAIQRHAKVASMAGPTADQRSILSKIVGRDSLSDDSMQFLSRELRGLEPEAYKEGFLDDLVLLEAADEDNDPLERFVVNAVLRLLRAFRGCKMKLIRQEDIESGLGGSLAIVGGRVYQWDKSTYSRANRVIGAMFSTVVPVASVVTLYAVQSMGLRVGLVCVFSLVFCLALSTLTKTRRIEVFAATAAFMSVQLVFISQGN
ncbi:hypothetical protein J7T55_012132 [Diaporthe amygdali]|uniref:uncharacterized protein n=1 Tax=Phomopsis amygdali TaxID=1214568 RepID=UPI0022FE169D|nr:uncharacterized protein J7T55_012132 [Diaporthe amygdali]KAJ0123666.1 hypothetical protein J7T55_012132 [Diaporthe amygdali]